MGDYVLIVLNRKHLQCHHCLVEPSLSSHVLQLTMLRLCFLFESTLLMWEKCCKKFDVTNNLLMSNWHKHNVVSFLQSPNWPKPVWSPKLESFCITCLMGVNKFIQDHSEEDSIKMCSQSSRRCSDADTSIPILWWPPIWWPVTWNDVFGLVPSWVNTVI